MNVITSTEYIMASFNKVRFLLAYSGFILLDVCSQVGERFFSHSAILMIMIVFIIIPGLLCRGSLRCCWTLGDHAERPGCRRCVSVHHHEKNHY